MTLEIGKLVETFLRQAGLILGVLCAYAIEFWWSYKGIEPRPILSTHPRG